MSKLFTIERIMAIVVFTFTVGGATTGLLFAQDATDKRVDDIEAEQKTYTGTLSEVKTATAVLVTEQRHSKEQMQRVLDGQEITRQALQRLIERSQ